MSIVATLKGRLGSLRLDVMRSGKVPRPEGSPAEVAARLSAFVTQLSPDERLRRYDYLEVLQGADVAFGAQHFNEADAIYSFLVARGQGGYWARLRQADLARLRGDYDTALAQIDALADDPEFDQRGELVRARVYLAQADYVRAAASLRMVVAADPTNVDFLRMLFRALEGSGDTEALAQPEPLVAHLDPDEQFAFIFRARCFCGEVGAVHELMAARPALVRSAESSVVAQCLRMLGRQEDRAGVLRIGELTQAVRSDSPDVLSALLSAYCALGEWTKGEAMVDHASHILWQTRNGALWQSLLYFLCRTERFDEAQDLLAQWGTLADVPRAASGTVAVLLASTRQWDRVIAFLADRVDQGMDIAAIPLLFGAIGEAARQTRRYAEVIGLLERSLKASASSVVARQRDRLVLEVAFLEEIGLGAGIGSGGAGLAEGEYAERLGWWRTLLSRGEPAEVAWPDAEVAEVAVDGGIFLCTDRNYLIGTTVAVWSLLRHNRGLKTTWPLTVVCGTDGLELAQGFFASLAQASGVEIRVIGAESVLLGEGGFRTSWGIFTAHPGLTEATYYRMFAAQWLLEQGLSGRALYLDSDTVPGAHIARLFAVDLAGQPLGARTDASLPGVQEAAAKLGLDVTTYFNAGVLVLDLDHDALGEALARTITFAQEHPELLTFFDQCALNLGFAGLRTTVPDAFNYFISPAETPSALPGAANEPIVRHFIGPPKPWDPVYDGDNCVPWLAELAALGEVLTPEELQLLLSLPFTRRHSNGPAAVTRSD